jgi:hypothetical protein
LDFFLDDERRTQTDATAADIADRLTVRVTAEPAGDVMDSLVDLLIARHERRRAAAEAKAATEAAERTVR